MSTFTFSQFKDLIQPLEELVSGIVKIVGAENPDQEKTTSAQLLDQILLSVTIMHASQKSQGKNLPTPEEIKQMMEKDGDEIGQKFTQDLTKELFIKYLEESATIVMTNYYYQVKDQVTPEKSAQIAELQQQIGERL